MFHPNINKSEEKRIALGWLLRSSSYYYSCGDHRCTTARIILLQVQWRIVSNILLAIWTIIGIRGVRTCARETIRRVCSAFEPITFAVIACIYCNTHIARRRMSYITACISYL
uniref:Uncharacterized protein n=1 Tax=Trichogramma kaykai TaxID=54128 RepID=A0ABD2X438_9HYME